MDQNGYDLAPPDAPLLQVPCDPVGGLVDFAIAALHVSEDQRRRVRPLLRLLPEQADDVVGLASGYRIGQEAVQRLQLRVGGDVHLIKALPAEELPRRLFIGPREALHALPLVQVGSVGDAQLVLALKAEYLSHNLLLGIVALNRIRHKPAAQEVHLRHQIALVGKQRGNGQVEVGAHVRIGKQAAGAVLADLIVQRPQVIGDGLLAVEALQHREGLHEHADASRDFRRAPAVDGGVQRLLRPGKAAEQIAIHAGEERAGANAQAMGIGGKLPRIHVQRNGEPCVPGRALLLVVDGRAADLRIGQQSVVPRLRACEGLRAPRLLLHPGRVARGHGLALGRFPGIGPVELAQQHMKGGAVIENVVNVHEEVGRIAVREDVQPVQLSVQVGEGLNQRAQIRLALALGNVDGDFLAAPLGHEARDDAARLHLKAGKEVGMGAEHLPEGVLQPVQIRSLRQREQAGEVVRRSLRVHTPLQIHTKLRHGDGIAIDLHARSSSILFFAPV